jgi:hypothetical protein
MTAQFRLTTPAITDIKIPTVSAALAISHQYY